MSAQPKPWEERYEVEWLPVDDLKPKGFQNPNVMTPLERAKLKVSIQEQGIVPPLLVRLETNEVIDGEHRWLIARDELGWEEVPVIRRSMTDAQARIIARRMIAARGDESAALVDALMQEIASLGALDDAQSGLLLTDEEIAHWESEIEVEALPDPVSDEAYIEEFTPRQPQADAPLPTRPINGGGEDGTELDPDLSDVFEEQEDEVDTETPSFDPLPGPPAPRTHRVNVLFIGDEADLAQRVLGRAPSARIAQMCHYWETEDMDTKLLDAEDNEEAEETTASTE